MLIVYYLSSFALPEILDFAARFFNTKLSRYHRTLTVTEELFMNEVGIGLSHKRIISVLIDKYLFNN